MTQNTETTDQILDPDSTEDLSSNREGSMIKPIINRATRRKFYKEKRKIENVLIQGGKPSRLARIRKQEARRRRREEKSVV